MKESIFGDKYLKATWFCIGLIVFGQLSGVNAIMWSSNSILNKMNKDGGISPRMCTVLIGIINFVDCILALFISRRLGRKTLVIIGHFLMGPILILVGVFAILQHSTLA